MKSTAKLRRPQEMLWVGHSTTAPPPQHSQMKHEALGVWLECKAGRGIRNPQRCMRLVRSVGFMQVSCHQHAVHQTPQ